MNSLRFILIAAAVGTAGAQPGNPNNQRGDNPGALPLAPEVQQTLFHVPPGFEVQLVAAEPQIAKPMNIAFDAAGRLWVTCTELYPFPARTDANGERIPEFDAFWQKASTRFKLGESAPTPVEVGRDRVQILSDFGADGRARQARTFADHLNIPIGVQPLPRAPGTRGDSAVVFSIPAIWRMEDRDGDGRAEVKRSLFSGFGFEDTHGMSSNYTYGLDGWIYGNHGHANHSEIQDSSGQRTIFDGGSTYRFRADGSHFERWTHGQTNPFGTAFDEAGNLYTADSHSKPVYRLLRGGYYEGIAKKHDGLGFAPPITKDPHGSTGIAGIAYYGAEQFPADYAGNLFNGNPITQRINRVRLVWQGASPQAVRLADFLTCDDPSFRPVQVKLGPDGALYIADFYNPIIGHYEARLTHPARDHTRGRIWRVVWRGRDRSRAAPLLPDLSRDDGPALLEMLKIHNVALRGLVVSELVERLGRAGLASWREAARARLMSAEAKVPGEALALVFALERFGALPPAEVLADWVAMGGERALGVLQVLADRPSLDGGGEKISRVAQEKHAAGPEWLAVAAVWSQHPQRWQGPSLLRMIEATPAADAQLHYALRLALKKVVAAASLEDITGWAEAEPGYSELLADVALAVEQPFVADFLLAHLERTRFAGPRVGDYVKHAAGGLSAERFSTLCDIARRLRSAASLTQQLAVCEGLGLATKRLGQPLPADVKAWSEDVISRALENDDPKLVERALETSASYSAPRIMAAWEKIILNRSRGALRTTALQLMPADERGQKVAMKALQHRPDAKLLEAIGKRLGTGMAGEASQAALADALLTADAEQSVMLATALARTDTGGVRLVALAEAGKISPRLLVRAPVASALETRPSALRARVSALTAAFPSESVRLDELIAKRVASFRTVRTDPINGAKLFAMHCAACHRFKETGGNVGPNLDGISARGPARLLEDILDPSRNVDPAFQRTTLKLRTGEEVVGMNVQASPETVTLTEMDGKMRTFSPAEIASTRTETVSVMPAVFEQSIAPDDLSDLVAYLMK